MVLLLLPLVTGGCYLGHVARGQAALLWSRRPVESVIRDPSIPEEIRERLALVQAARSYATRLGLEVGGQYRSYVEWPGDRLVTAVVATRPGEVEPRGFWFPIVGRVPYKGFFDEGRAEAEAGRLRAEGLDVCLVPVPAYSTLGWMDDPVTTPLLRLSEGTLVETVLHELVHATVFVESAAAFNEGVATFIGQEAARRFFTERYGAGSPEAEHERARIAEERAIARSLGELRREVARLYAALPAGPERDRERARIEREAREQLTRLELRTRDPRSLAEDLRLNDACLALAATYEGELDAYQQQLDALGGDLPAFIARVRAAAESDDPRAVLLGAELRPPAPAR